jgi:tRNA(Arg) A34 adenosine deaminase TadA
MSFNSTGSTMCNSRDVRIAAIALQEADRSTMKYHQHGCVAVANGQIIARGTNSYRCQSNDGYLTDTCSCHAEIDVLRKLERILAKKNLSVSRRNGRQCFLWPNQYVRRKKRCTW